jgi:hypothetical protein
MPLRGSYKLTNYKENNMIHLLDAAKAVNKPKYIKIEGNKVIFWIQDGPIKEFGANGVQATDMLEYVKELFVSLNAAYPCRENALTITKIEEAVHWQNARTADREKRDVEGKSLA